MAKKCHFGRIPKILPKTIQLMNPYLYIFGTLFFTVYGQIVLKWRLSGLKIILPDGLLDKVIYLVKLIFDPFVFSGFVSAFIASLFWMAAMTKFEITHAYPFMSLAPALVFVIGIVFLGEAYTIGKLIGLILIMIGIFVTVKY
jgi:drug/metabolite transporter (DMT)-like permease